MASAGIARICCKRRTIEPMALPRRFIGSISAAPQVSSPIPRMGLSEWAIAPTRPQAALLRSATDPTSAEDLTQAGHCAPASLAAPGCDDGDHAPSGLLP